MYPVVSWDTQGSPSLDVFCICAVLSKRAAWFIYKSSLEHSYSRLINYHPRTFSTILIGGEEGAWGGGTRRLVIFSLPQFPKLPVDSFEGLNPVKKPGSEVEE